MLKVESTRLSELRQAATDFSVDLSDAEKEMLKDADLQIKEFDGVDMEMDIRLAELLDDVERRGKASINIRRMSETTARHSAAVRDWFNDPCYDLFESDHFTEEESRDLRAFQRIALDSGSSNAQQVLYIMRLEQRLAKVEMRLDHVMKDVPDGSVARPSNRPRG